MRRGPSELERSLDPGSLDPSRTDEPLDVVLDIHPGEHHSGRAIVWLNEEELGREVLAGPGQVVGRLLVHGAFGFAVLREGRGPRFFLVMLVCSHGPQAAGTIPTEPGHSRPSTIYLAICFEGCDDSTGFVAQRGVPIDANDKAVLVVLRGKFNPGIQPRFG